jgi:hypothetical protein
MLAVKDLLEQVLPPQEVGAREGGELRGDLGLTLQENLQVQSRKRRKGDEQDS